MQHSVSEIIFLVPKMVSKFTDDAMIQSIAVHTVHSFCHVRA